MTSLQELLLRAARDLDNLGFDWALVGGLAVSARTKPRFTADVDLAVEVSDDRQTESLIRALSKLGWTVDALVEQQSARRLATVRLVANDETGPVVDLLFASSGVEPEIVAAAEALEVLQVSRSKSRRSVTSLRSSCWLGQKTGHRTRLTSEPCSTRRRKPISRWHAKQWA